MMRNIFFTVVLSAIVSLSNLHACISIDKQDHFIQMYSHIAMQEMYRSGIPASITLAQAIKESGWGTTDLAINSNNYFGIKCKPEWNGKRYYHKDDDLDKNGQLIKSCFRVYDNIERSFTDHTDFIVGRNNYAGCFQYDSDNYIAWAMALKAGGYATLATYDIDLINLIEKYNLNRFDQKGHNTTMQQAVHVNTSGSGSYFNPNKVILNHDRLVHAPIVERRKETVEEAPVYVVAEGLVNPSVVSKQSTIPAPPPTERIDDNYVPKWKQGTSMEAKGHTSVSTPQTRVLPTRKKTVPQGKKSVGTYKRHTRNIQYRPSASSSERR